ncbi:leucine--tRNA ligase, cytoplasmic-like, partial [Lotus japonicus]|uniref:leucine--tRNA ligase, cytoplasmic-like n=1 Tax=Lotus japonicus TaxID=34305 RepID=UPI002585C7A0
TFGSTLAGRAIVYSEPEKKVLSRSGDECVVALTEQWYITYGESEWKKLAEECLSSINLFSDETRHGFEHTLSWLNQWACSRSFGLGTRIPWDDQFLVESISDSTIYMAYYTIVHYLQNGDMYGSTDQSVIKPQHLTDDVWDYIFCDGPFPKSTDISSSLLDIMKKEFEYWYPFDVRVSGKDPIQNHLTFCLYNHTAIMSKHHWPRGFRCNGHIKLNNNKMSKSTGNFRTIRQTIEEYSADATRLALANAGDGVDDANFEFNIADKTIKRLTKEIEWYEKILAAESSMTIGPPSTLADRVFANEINIAVKTTEQNYSNYMFREALRTGFYELQIAKDEYIFSCGVEGYNRELVWRFMDVQTRLLAPICPHYAEFIWRELLKKEGFMVKAGWPTADVPDLTLKSSNKSLHDSIIRIRKLLQKQLLGSEYMVTAGLIYVNEQLDDWKVECLNILRNKFNRDTRTFAPESEILEALEHRGHSCQQCRPFLNYMKGKANEHGAEVLDLRFSEMEVLKQNLDLIKRQLALEHVEILSAADADSVAKAGDLANVLTQNPSSPGNPTAVFLKTKSEKID